MAHWKGIILIFRVACVSFAIVDGLKCYQCSWSNNPEEHLKHSLAHGKRISPLMADDPAEAPRPEYPEAKPYISSKVQRVPTKEDIEKECDIRVCPESDNTCLKWSFVSNKALNATYKCVSSHTSGCFEQNVDLKDVRSHLRKEVCLCNSDLCNGAKIPSNIAWPILILGYLIYIFYTN